MIKTVEWTNEGVSMLDQRLLPNEEKYLMLRSYEEVADAIKKMVVRGAPAIGISAAMGLALGASQSVGTSVADLEYDFDFMCKVMEAPRPGPFRHATGELVTCPFCLTQWVTTAGVVTEAMSDWVLPASLTATTR